jgi:RNA polymerase subunit RPABC4/transcription elongation factor Spt4
MFCKHCRKQIDETSNFCPYCGGQVREMHTTEEVLQVLKEKSPSAKLQTNKKNILGWVITIISIVIGYILGKYLGVVFFAFILVGYIAYWFGGWYSKREKQSYKIKNIICWSNTISWLIPILGLGTGIIAYRFGQIDKVSKYRKLGILGLVLSIINGIAGLYLSYIGH